MKKPKEDKPSDDKMTDLLLQINQERRDRVDRAQKAILAVCQNEKVDIVVASLNLIDGRFVPIIKIVPINDAG